MTVQVDFVLQAPETNTLLLVETKATNAPSAEFAAEFARNLLEHRRLPENLYFLFVFRNNLYLWKHRPEGIDLPDLEGKTEEVLAPYLTTLTTSLRDITSPSFELLVRSWIADLADGTAPESVEEWARAAGLQQFENGVIREDQPN